MIDPANYGLVEMGFTALAVLGFAGWQLYAVNRDTRRARESQERARHAVGEHGLDDR